MKDIRDLAYDIMMTFVPKDKHIIELKREIVDGIPTITQKERMRSMCEGFVYIAHDVFGKELVSEMKLIPAGSPVVMTIKKRFVSGDKIAELIVPIMKIRNLKNIMNEYHLITGEIR